MVVPCVSSKKTAVAHVVLWEGRTHTHTWDEGGEGDLKERVGGMKQRGFQVGVGTDWVTGRLPVTGRGFIAR